jgi:hypothetical protein
MPPSPEDFARRINGILESVQFLPDEANAPNPPLSTDR